MPISGGSENFWGLGAEPSKGGNAVAMASQGSGEVIVAVPHLPIARPDGCASPDADQFRAL